MRHLISKQETGQRVGYHPEHVMRLAREGGFPRPIKLGAGSNCAVRFDVAEIEAWVEERAAAREPIPA